MKKLNQQETIQILEKFSEKFGRNKDKVIKRYLKHKTIPIPFFGGIDIGSPLPNFWCAQNKSEKEILDIYKSVVTFDIAKFKTNKKSNEPAMKYFLSLIKKFFIKENIKSMYAVGNWINRDLAKHAVNFSINDFPENIIKTTIFDNYMFPENLEWVLASTHENFYFLAGKKSFINKFKKIYKDYKKYSIDMNYVIVNKKLNT